MNLCAEEPAVATTFKLPLSRNTSAGRPVAPDTAPLPLSFLPPFGRETISDSPCPGGCAPRGKNLIHLIRAESGAVLSLRYIVKSPNSRTLSVQLTFSRRPHRS